MRLDPAFRGTGGIGLGDATGRAGGGMMLTVADHGGPGEGGVEHIRAARASRN